MKNIDKIAEYRTGIIRISVAVIALLILSWTITNAEYILGDDMTDAKDNFSVIGVVGDVDDNYLTLTSARGSDGQVDAEYKLNIKYLDQVETQNYTPLIISDIKVGDQIIAQGLTDGSKFFIKRIISFSYASEQIEIEIATTTDDLATTTEDVATSTATSTDETATDETSGGESSTETPVEETITKEVSTSTEETVDQSTVTPEVIEPELNTETPVDEPDTIIPEEPQTPIEEVVEETPVVDETPVEPAPEESQPAAEPEPAPEESPQE